MNAVFFIICALSLSVSCVFSPEKVMPAALNGISQALTLALTLVPVYAVWSGIYKIFENADLSDKAAKILQRPINALFNRPRAKTREYLSLNIAANALGVSGAATPLGIKACKALEDEGKKEELELFLVLSAAPFQLLPTTAMTLMISRGASNAPSIILPCLAATLFGAICSVIILKSLQAARRAIKKLAISKLPQTKNETQKPTAAKKRF